MRNLLMPLSALAYLAIATILSVSAADPTAPAKPLESPQFLRLHRNEAGGAQLPSKRLSCDTAYRQNQAGPALSRGS